eukprot:496378-Prorocentrum_minimum.AAC.1
MKQQSTTYTTLSSVTLVSAMLEDTTTRRVPRGSGSNTCHHPASQPVSQSASPPVSQSASQPVRGGGEK